VFPEQGCVTSTNSDRAIALDPGVRTFLTGFDALNFWSLGVVRRAESLACVSI
jgi:putative transposase